MPRARLEYRRELQSAPTISLWYADLIGGPEYAMTPAGVSRNALLPGLGGVVLFVLLWEILVDAFGGGLTSLPPPSTVALALGDLFRSGTLLEETKHTLLATFLGWAISVGIGLTASIVNPVAFSYGYDRLRFIKPVFIGDTIRTRTTITAKEDDPKRPGSGRVIERCEVINQRGDVVMTYNPLRMTKRGS